MRIVKKLHFVGSFEHQGQHKKFSGDIVADSAKPSMKITGRLPTGEKFSGLTPSIDILSDRREYKRGYVIGEYGTGLEVSVMLDSKDRGLLDFHTNETKNSKYLDISATNRHKYGNAVITGSVIYDKTGREIEKTGDLPASAFTAANNKPQSAGAGFKNIPAYLTE